MNVAKIDKVILDKDVYQIINELGWIDWEGGWPSFCIHAGDVDINVCYYKQNFNCTFFCTNESGNCVCIAFYAERDEVDFVNTDKDYVELVLKDDITDIHMQKVNLCIEDLPVLKDITFKMYTVVMTLMG